MRRIQPSPANPGASSSATLFDSKEVEPGRADSQKAQRGVVAAYISHAATFLHEWYAPGSSNARVVNGSGSGDAITANTYFSKDYALLPGRNVFRITTGTAPTTWEVGFQLIDQSS